MVYFPNGSAGEILDAQCAICPAFDHQCPVALVQCLHNYDQCNHPEFESAMNILINERGLCQLKPVIESLAGPEPTAPKTGQAGQTMTRDALIEKMCRADCAACNIPPDDYEEDLRTGEGFDTETGRRFYNWEHGKDRMTALLELVEAAL